MYFSRDTLSRDSTGVSSIHTTHVPCHNKFAVIIYLGISTSLKPWSSMLIIHEKNVCIFLYKSLYKKNAFCGQNISLLYVHCPISLDLFYIVSY